MNQVENVKPEIQNPEVVENITPDKKGKKTAKALFITALVLTIIATVALVLCACFLVGIADAKVKAENAENWEGIGHAFAIALFLIIYIISSIVALVLSVVGLFFSIPSLKLAVDKKLRAWATAIMAIDIVYISVDVITFVVAIVVFNNW